MHLPRTGLNAVRLSPAKEDKSGRRRPRQPTSRTGSTASSTATSIKGNGSSCDPLAPAYTDQVFTVVIETIRPKEKSIWLWHPGAVRQEIDCMKEPRTKVEFALENAGGGTRGTVAESGFLDDPGIQARRSLQGEHRRLGSASHVVRTVGLEPTWVAPPDPKSGASANFATSAPDAFFTIAAPAIRLPRLRASATALPPDPCRRKLPNEGECLMFRMRKGAWEFPIQPGADGGAERIRTAE